MVCRWCKKLLDPLRETLTFLPEGTGPYCQKCAAKK